MPKASAEKTRPNRRNAEASKAAILKAALVEFSNEGYAGARVDNIARAAGLSKPLIYTYFGDKDAIYAAALREAYVQIREGEASLDLDRMDPEDAIRKLVSFTLSHFRKNPWFISMLNTENLLGGNTIRNIHDATEIQSGLVAKLDGIIKRGVAAGQFRDGIDPLEFYIFVASVCYFPVSNRHTLRTVFGCPLDDEWLDQHEAQAAEMMVRYLRP